MIKKLIGFCFTLFVIFIGGVKLYAQDCSVLCPRYKVEADQKQILEKLKGIKFRFSPDIQPPVVYAEPAYTSCNCNHIFWEPVSDTNVYWYFVQWSLDSSFSSVYDFTLTRSTDTVEVADDLPEAKFWYRVYSLDSSMINSSLPSNYVFSTQDFSPPITSCSLPVPGEWITTESFPVYFCASDSAGVDSVFFYYRTSPNSNWKHYDAMEFPNKPKQVCSSFVFVAPDGDYYYEFFIGAKDYAKAPDWYPGDTRSAGNSKKPYLLDPAHCHIKVDTHNPFSKITNLDTLYTSTDFQIPFIAYDTAFSYHSGIDTVWLYSNFNGGPYEPYDTMYNFDDTSVVDSAFDFAADSGDGSYCFFTKSKDKAGNTQDVFDTVCTRVFTDVRVDLTLFDLEDTLDTEYTGSCTVGVKIEPNVFPVDSVILCENPTFIGCTTKLLNASKLITDTFIFSCYQDRLETLYVKIWVKGKDAQDYANIILDTHPPDLFSLSLYSPFSQDSSWTSTQEILVRFAGQDTFPGVCGAIQLSEDANFITSQIIQISSCIGEVNYVFNTSDTERKTVYGKLLDRAENESQIRSASILLYETAHNYPNPFNPNNEKTNLVFRLRQDGMVKIMVYDLFGNSVFKKTVQGSQGLNDGRSNPEFQWDGRNMQGEIVGNGGYICILKIGDETFSTHKIAVVK